MAFGDMNGWDKKGIHSPLFPDHENIVHFPILCFRPDHPKESNSVTLYSHFKLRVSLWEVEDTVEFYQVKLYFSSLNLQ